MNALQEEITQKTLALCVEASKMTAQLLQQAMKKVLADMEKHKKNPQLRHGKQTLRQLMKHNTGVSNIEITDQNILPVGADGIHHEVHQLVQPVFIQLHILRENVIFDVLQNQCPIALPLSHPILSRPLPEGWGT